MGFLLEEIPQEQHELLPTPLKDAVEGATQIISDLSADDETRFERAIAEESSRLILAIQKFAKVLNDSGASARIAGDENRVSLSLDNVAMLARRLNEVDVTEQETSLEGVLLGILPEARRFELRPFETDAPMITGNVSEDLVVKYTADTAFKERLLLRPVRASVTVARTLRSGRPVREKITLQALESADTPRR